MPAVKSLIIFLFGDLVMIFNKDTEGFFFFLQKKIKCLFISKRSFLAAM